MKTFILMTMIVVATAAQADEPRSVTVSLAGVDASSAHGAATVYARVQQGAEDVCSALRPDGAQLELRPRFEACVRTAMSGAIVRINRPLVSVYAAAHGVPTPASLAAVVARNP